MSTYAIGDIHGNLGPLEDLLSQMTPELRPEDTLVFLGDYIDRGQDARGCVERIIQLRSEAKFSVITLLGNHEQWMANRDDQFRIRLAEPSPICEIGRRSSTLLK